ncbi:hypothetical protein COB28_01410 [Candidatus Dependentiae bacterium]|nr:MAG: hypothetical protein COB28_01410 [Candidatus Dependentiae bacterium]
MDNNNKMETMVSSAQQWAKNNQSLIRGYGFLIFGAFLLYLTFKIIINMLLFLAGLFFIYDGCKKLNFTMVTTYLEKICNFIQCSCMNSKQ